MNCNTTHYRANSSSVPGDPTFSTLGAEINNESGLYQYIALELNVDTQASARSSGGRVEIWYSVAVDNTPNYPADSVVDLEAGFLTSFQLDAATTARKVTKTGIQIPPFKFKMYVRNVTGQAFASTNATTLKYRRYNEQATT